MAKLPDGTDVAKLIGAIRGEENIVAISDAYDFGTKVQIGKNVYVIGMSGRASMPTKVFKVVARLHDGANVTADGMDALYNQWVQSGGRDPLNKDKAAAVLFAASLDK